MTIVLWSFRFRQAEKRAEAFALEPHDDDERKEQRQDQVEQPEHHQRRQHLRLRGVGHDLDEREFEDAKPAWRMGNEGESERGEKGASTTRKPGLLAAGRAK